MFLYSQWLKTPINTRIKIAEQFGIKKTGSTHVSDNKIQNDGFLITDVESALTPEAISAYLGIAETHPERLWIALIDKIEGRTPLHPDTIKPGAVIEGTFNIVNTPSADIGYAPTAFGISSQPKKAKKKSNKKKK